MRDFIRRHGVRGLLVALPVLLAVLFWNQAALSQGPESGSKGLTPEARRAMLMERQAADGAAMQGVTEAAAAAPCVEGFAGAFPCANVDLMAHLPTSAIGGGDGADMWGWTDPETGTEYAVMARTNGTSFIDISDPENPLYLGNLPSHTGTSSWRELQSYQNYLVVVADLNGNHGMQIFDMTQLRDVTNPPVTFAETAHYNGIGSSHTVGVNEATGYADIHGGSSGGQTCNGGLHFVNLQNPLAPTFAGCFSADGYSHDALCLVYEGPDATYQGREVCFASNEDTVTIVDATNKAAPVQLARRTYAGSAYTHQATITPDHRYLLVDDELDETGNGHNTYTYIFDVSDLNAPVLINVYMAETTSIDHNQYIHNGFDYQANYTSGLRILNISDIANGNLTEEAYFDVVPANDDPEFTGAWSVFPYYESGLVAISTIDQGFFLVRPTLEPDFSLTATGATLARCGDGTVSTTLELAPQAGYSGSATLSAVGLPTGASASFTVNPVSVPGSSELTVTVSGVAAGSYPFTVQATDGTLVHEVALTLAVYEGVPDAPTLLTPANGASNVGITPSFTWNAAAGGVTYTFELATDAAFTELVDSASGLTEGSYSTDVTLAASTTYYWRVRSENPCGTGAFGATFSFTTGNIVTETFVSTDVPKAIGPNSGTITVSSLTIAAQGEVADINVVDMRGAHTYVGDVSFRLISPSGRAEVVLIDQACGSSDNFRISLDDEAPAPVACPLADNETAQPQEPLSAFDGEPVAGTWTLRIEDHFNQDGGVLAGWGLEVTYTAAGVQAGTLRGVVTSAESGEPIANATVFAGAASTSTDSLGAYSLELPAGVYEVSASAEGYTQETVEGVDVPAGGTAEVDFELETAVATAVGLVRMASDGPSALPAVLMIAAGVLLLGGGSLVARRKRNR